MLVLGISVLPPLWAGESPFPPLIRRYRWSRVCVVAGVVPTPEGRRTGP
jgi:hypothetical protein